MEHGTQGEVYVCIWKEGRGRGAMLYAGGWWKPVERMKLT